MRHFLCVFIIPISLFAGFFDWFQDPPPKIDYSCQFHCGEWGSESIRKLEWEFVHCLYNAHEITKYIYANYNHTWLRYEILPEEFHFQYNPPENFSSLWYQKILDIDVESFVRLSNCNPTFVCSGCKDSVWRILHYNNGEGEHVGKGFVRKLTSNYYDDYENCGHSVLVSKMEYKLGNFIDFHHACLALENDILLEKNADKCRKYRKSPLFVEDIEARFPRVLQSIDQMKSSYRAIFEDCAINHGSPSAYYNLGLYEFSRGEYEKGLEYFKFLFEKINLESLEMNLASEICKSRGTLEVELGLYDQAIISLGKAIQSNPADKEVLFERANIYFERGEFDEALEDYLSSDFQNMDPFYKIQFGTISRISSGVAYGIALGAKQWVQEFGPEALSTLRGLGVGLWAFSVDPAGASMAFVDASTQLVEYMINNSSFQILQDLVPEIKELIQNYDRLSEYEKGKLIGQAIGKYGVEIFLFKYSMKGMKAYRDLKRANQLMTLEALASPKNTKHIRKAANEFWAARRDVIKNGNLKIKWCKQEIHIEGKNYEKGRSVFKHSDPQRLVNEFAGTGIKEGREIPGMPGYKEIVNFQEFIGYNISETTGEKTATTWGKIHYSKDGVHIVPTYPRE